MALVDDAGILTPTATAPTAPAPKAKGKLVDDAGVFNLKAKPTSGLAGPTQISAGASDGYDKNWFDAHTQNLAQKAWHLLNAHGHPDLADAAHALISKSGPHDATQAVTMGVSTALPIAAEAAPVFEEAAPIVAKGLEMLRAPGLKGAASRAVVTAGAGATTGGLPGAEQGAILSGSGELVAPVASKVSGLGVAETAGTDAMRENAVDTVSQKALENELGTTPEKAQALANPTEVGIGAQELAGGKKALSTARQSAIREVGDKYEPIYGPIQNNPAPGARLSKISEAAKDANQWAAAKGARLAPGTAKLLNDLEGLSSNDITLGGAGKAGGKFTLTNEQIAAMNESGGAVDAQTIGTLRGKLGQIVQTANQPGSSAIDRRVLMDASRPIVDTLNDAIPEDQKPLLQQINNEYAQVNRIFPFRDLKKLQSAATLPELGDAVFSAKAGPATGMAIKRMTPEQQGIMREAFAASILKDGASPTETLSKLAANKDAVKALYPDSDFGNIETWRKAMIAQKKFMQGPPNLPSQKAFEEGIQDTLKKSGLSPEAMQAATAALSNTGKQSWMRISPYMLASGLAGYGLLGHIPEVGAGLAAYALGHAGWKALANNPAMMDVYRQAIMSGWTRAGGEALGRLMVGGVNDAVRGSAPQHQATGVEEDGPGKKALKTSQAESIAPTQSASDRAGEVMADLGKGKNPEVHQDLQRGRLSLDEINKVLATTAKPNGAALLAHVGLSDAMDSVEVASPEERKMLIPLMEQKMRQSFAGGKYNRTLAASLAKRLQAVKAEA